MNIKNSEQLELLKNIVKKHYRGFTKTILCKHPELITFINENTPLLKDNVYKLKTKIYWLINDLKDFPKCKYCGKTIGINYNIRGLNYHYPKILL